MKIRLNSTIDNSLQKIMPKIRLISLFLSCLLLSACSVNHHLRQAEKHLRKAEQLGASVRVDTFYVTKTVVVPEVRTDTVLERVNFRDTITVERDKIKIRLRIDTLTKRVYIAVKCPPDTLKIRVPVTVTKTIETSFPWGWVILSWCVGVVMALFATKRR